MFIKAVLLLLRHIRKFFAGFVSVMPFVRTKLRGYPFAKPIYALDKDWMDIGNDIEIVTKKSKKIKK